MSIYIALLFFSLLSLVLGLILSYSSHRFPFKKDSITEEINACFPQSQCGQCGYPGCYAYAHAIHNQSEKIDKCIPGGYEVFLQISAILNIEIPIDHIIKKEKIILPSIVWIDEKNCVGCSKCAVFCPVDAIVGAPNFMHTVLEKFCTGCNICVLHCPTNCIHIKNTR